MTDPTSRRLRYVRLGRPDADSLHELAIDPHVRRYLLDGETVPRSWADDEVALSDTLFERFGVGIWLAYAIDAGDADPPIGFCGYRMFEDLHDDAPELLYAFRERFTGRGLATEVAGALVQIARDEPRLDRIVSAVDEPNGASIRVLEKVGFRRSGQVPGAFGNIVLFEL